MTVYYLELNNPQHAQSLFQVLRNTSKRRFWPADKDIKVGDDVLYRLHNRIVAVDSDVEGEVIYKSLSSHTLSKTKSSHIFEVELSFKFSSTGDICFLEHRPQIAKLITKPDCAIFTNFQQLVTTEYLISKDIKHLGVFSPIFRRNKALLVMNKMSGVELYYFIHKVLSQDINLTAQFIFMLTEALFKAFEEQVLAYQISHHDLKPENMLLNTEYGDRLLQASKEELEEYLPRLTEIKIVDYEHARKFYGTTFNKGGTAAYSSPEHSQQVFADEKSDLYALGIILQLIWGLYRYSSKAKIVELGERLLLPQTLEDIYHNKFLHQTENISFALFLRMSMLTINLVTTDSRKRWNFQQAKTAYKSIINAAHNHIEHDINSEDHIQDTEHHLDSISREESQIVSYPRSLFGIIRFVSRFVFDIVLSRLENLVNLMFGHHIADITEYGETSSLQRYSVHPNSSVSFTDYTPQLRSQLRLEIDKLQRVADGLTFFNSIDAARVEYFSEENSQVSDSRIDDGAAIWA